MWFFLNIKVDIVQNCSDFVQQKNFSFFTWGSYMIYTNSSSCSLAAVHWWTILYFLWKLIFDHSCTTAIPNSIYNVSKIQKNHDKTSEISAREHLWFWLKKYNIFTNITFLDICRILEKDCRSKFYPTICLSLFFPGSWTIKL